MARSAPLARWRMRWLRSPRFAQACWRAISRAPLCPTASPCCRRRRPKVRPRWRWIRRSARAYIALRRLAALETRRDGRQSVVSLGGRRFRLRAERAGDADRHAASLPVAAPRDDRRGRFHPRGEGQLQAPAAVHGQQGADLHARRRGASGAGRLLSLRPYRDRLDLGADPQRNRARSGPGDSRARPRLRRRAASSATFIGKAT